MDILIVKDKKFKVEIVNNILKIDNIFAHNEETYVFKCFIKAFLKYKRANKYKNFTECLNASFASDGFNYE